MISGSPAAVGTAPQATPTPAADLPDPHQVRSHDHVDAAGKVVGSREPASFRDPSGFVFVENGVVRRQVNSVYFPQYDKLMASGLYAALSRSSMLVKHELIDETADRKVIQPEQLPFISYPYEWSFSQLKDAALLTLDVHLTALSHGMILKDATAFNVQFADAKPVFIDTLSFDFYHDGAPWVAYGQFCRHFLAPLLLMKYIAPELIRQQTLFLDGIPLEIASAMLPLRTHFSPLIKANIHLHAKSLSKYKEKFSSDRQPKVSLMTHKNIVNSLKGLVQGLRYQSQTQWGDYYSFANYDDAAFRFKEGIVTRWIGEAGVKRLWDIGGNDGHFSRLVQHLCDRILCTDIDALAVDKNYLQCKQRHEEKIIPLVVDYMNPTPGLGFANKERKDLRERVKAFEPDCILALALVHHLCISNNCTFEMLADSFNSVSKRLIIEFVHPTDSWAAKLLQSKRDARHLFDFYNKQSFESAFSEHYRIVEQVEVPGSERTLYLMDSR